MQTGGKRNAELKSRVLEFKASAVRPKKAVVLAQTEAQRIKQDSKSTAEFLNRY